MTSELLSGDFLVFEWLGKCLYEDPLETEFVVLHKAWGVKVRGGSSYIAPAEFVSDGGSLPGFLWPILGNPFSRARPGYLLHDAAYHRRLLCFQPDGTVRTLTKQEGDALMYFVALKNGMGVARMKTIWQGVHTFGGPSWRRYDDDVLAPEELLKKFDYTLSS